MTERPALQAKAAMLIRRPVAVASTEGFTLVLAGAKALLEDGVRLNLVPDRFPPGIRQ
jgi:hypothetical protein